MLSCLLVSSWAWASAGSAVDPPLTIYESELTELLMISQQLKQENVQLSLSLATSDEALKQVEQKLQDSESRLKASAERLLKLEDQQALSAQELTRLKELQAQVLKELIALQRSFEAYKSAAEAKIRSLEASGWLALGGGIVLGGLTVYVIDRGDEIVAWLKKTLGLK